MYEVVLMCLYFVITFVLVLIYKRLGLLSKIIKPNAFNSVEVKHTKKDFGIPSANYMWIQEVIDEDLSIHASGTYKSLLLKAILNPHDSDFSDYSRFYDVKFVISCSDGKTELGKEWVGFISPISKKFSTSPVLDVAIQVSEEGYKSFKSLINQLLITPSNKQGRDLEIFISGELVEGSSEGIGIREIDQMRLILHSELEVYDRIVSKLPTCKTSSEREHLLKCLNNRREFN